MKHVPARTCIVCRTKFDKRELVRIVYTNSGLYIDLSGKMSGRGAYLCTGSECWEYVMKSNILGKALKVALTDQDYERLSQGKPSS